MRGLLLLSLAGCAFSQGATLTMSGPASAFPGQSITVNLALTGSAGLSLSGFQFSLSLPAVSPAVSAAALAAGKGVYCAGVNCLVVGETNGANPVLSNNPMVDGVAVTFQLTLSSTAPAGALAFPLSNLLGASTAGAAVPIASGPVYSVRVASKCDANQDGVTDLKDVQAVVTAANSGTSCPLLGPCNVVSVVAVLLGAIGGLCTL